MKRQTRREFLKTGALASLSLPFISYNGLYSRPLLAFATLGCPDWSLEKMLQYAVEFGFDGIEFRGLQRQFDLTKCTEFSNRKNIKASAKRIADHKIRIVDLGSSAVMHLSDPLQRKENLDLGKRFIDLAAQLNCPFIRVFPDKFVNEMDKAKSVDLIARGLHELGEFAKGTNVTVLLSTHGDVVHSDDVENIIQLVGLRNVGIGWDMVNMWSVTKEPIPDIYRKLKKYIQFVHVKNLKLVNGQEQIVIMSEGEAPIFEGIDLLVKDGYKGYFSFVWEKYWFPELPEPELAFSDYIKWMRHHFSNSG